MLYSGSASSVNCPLSPTPTRHPLHLHTAGTHSPCPYELVPRNVGSTLCVIVRHVRGQGLGEQALRESMLVHLESVRRRLRLLGIRPTRVVFSKQSYPTALKPRVNKSWSPPFGSRVPNVWMNQCEFQLDPIQPRVITHDKSLLRHFRSHLLKHRCRFKATCAQSNHQEETL